MARRSATSAHFTPALFSFLAELHDHNERDWFNENKARYETHVKDAALRFIVDFTAPLQRISRHYVTDPRPVGGSLMRIYKDTRFARDKSPYKTNVGIQFRHAAGKDVHAPGFYLHLATDEIFAGVGLWHPEPEPLARIRERIVDKPAEWKKAISGKAFASRFERGGDSLKRPPAGFDPQHPHIDDLKRKDHIAMVRFSRKEVCAPDFLDRFAEACGDASGYMEFLTTAVGLPYG